ncbi:Magnesium chelatase, subunit ChlI [Salegentibacter agarivorans]|uniref:Magnesium chelatase, subunit ChlI n=1 Tax=Salegentibacter agarivorans TaxID=345907 RepID=A0A1I2K2E0_9FLAO|nr:Magnesium chelatase, subunit ChlI [Salegentibacter agarivorans]
MTLHEALETTKIHSVVGRVKEHVGLMSQRPFRSPHHTISDVALVGVGRIRNQEKFLYHIMASYF